MYIPKDPFVCPKKGIGPPTFLFFSDGIGTQKILFDRAIQNTGTQIMGGISPSYAQIIIYFRGSSNLLTLGGSTWDTCFNPDQLGEASK